MAKEKNVFLYISYWSVKIELFMTKNIWLLKLNDV